MTALSSGEPLDLGLRVTLHFHPDRTTLNGMPLLAALARGGVYRSQFETGTSNGGLTAYPGGDRWRWESRIFGGSYDDAPVALRPKYGALNFRRKPVGASPRFGSAHLRLNEETLQRTTFCYPDSFFEPAHFGVAARMDLIGLAEADDRDPLDDYIEAQVHGVVRLNRDVEALVLDPCFRGTEIETLAHALLCPVEWHHGFRLTINEFRKHPESSARPRALGRTTRRRSSASGTMWRASAHPSSHDQNGGHFSPPPILGVRNSRSEAPARLVRRPPPATGAAAASRSRRCRSPDAAAGHASAGRLPDHWYRTGSHDPVISRNEGQTEVPRSSGDDAVGHIRYRGACVSVTYSLTTPDHRKTKSQRGSARDVAPLYPPRSVLVSPSQS